jgi:uncharacterized protein (TIGR03083 family)
MTSTPMTTRADAPALAAEEYAALLATARTLEPGAWSAPTDCAGWTVRDIVAHVTGAAEEAARLPVLLRHYVRALTHERQREVIDSVNDQQLADRAGDPPAQLIEELERLAPLAVRGRQRVPALLRRVRMPAAAGALPGDTLGYLLDVIYTRDLWMHRVDITRATGTTMSETAGEPMVVGQVVRDLSRAWTGEPFMLTLTGRVTGTWAIGGGPDPSAASGSRPEVSVDCVCLCRRLSGRSDELPASHEEPAGPVVERLRGTRVLF